MPQPIGFCVHVAPSSSVNAIRLQPPISCETNVRFVCGSVQRMGSRLMVEVTVAPTLVQFAVAGVVLSLKLMRNVSRPDCTMALPVFRFTPMEGSPSPVPMRVTVGSVGTGGTKFWKMLVVAAGGVGGVTIEYVNVAL